MLSRKPFKELSKSQRNRRLKQVSRDESLLPQAFSPSTPIDNGKIIGINDTGNATGNNATVFENITGRVTINEDVPGDAIINEDFSDDTVFYEDVIGCNCSNTTLNDCTISRSSLDLGNDNNIEKNSNIGPVQINISHANISSTEDIDTSQNKIFNVIGGKLSLERKIAQWQCEYNISQAACGALLKILIDVDSAEELKKLPKDPRTLLGTPKHTNIRSVLPGEYFHYGLHQGLVDQLRAVDDISDYSTNIQINVHIDGLPISKSSKRQLYPILAEIYPKITTPFVIGVYHGFEKPNKCEEYLEDFINEYNILHAKGFKYNYKMFYVTIRAVICDSPARSFVKQTKGHNAYYGCSKCIQEGNYSEHRMRFLQTDAPLRTDDNFRKRLNENHHLGTSKFEETEVDMVSQFPVEYMHLVCLGVVKKIINLWIKGCRLNKIKFLKFSHRMIENISASLTSIKTWIPSEFVRKTRELGEVDRWKATELRLFLLYVGPIVFKDYLPKEYLHHFNSLNCAIRILSDETNCITNNACAKSLLHYFVTESIELYGKNFVIYNVHNLLHLADDVLKFGPLDSFGAFSFESYLYFIKKVLKKGEKPLQQLHKRLEERASCCYQQKIVKNVLKKPEVINFNSKKSKLNKVLSYDKINYGSFILSASQTCDKFCYITNNNIFCINNIYKKNDDIILQGKLLINSKSLGNYPIESKLLSIVTGNEWSNFQNISASDVSKKAVCIPCNDKSFCFFPMIHSSN